MSSENVCKVKTAGKTSSKLINYFCNVDVNVCESEAKLARPTPRARARSVGRQRGGSSPLSPMLATPLISMCNTSKLDKKSRDQTLPRTLLDCGAIPVVEHVKPPILKSTTLI